MVVQNTSELDKLKVEIHHLQEKVKAQDYQTTKYKDIDGLKLDELEVQRVEYISKINEGEN